MTDPALQQDFAEDVVLLKLVGMNPVVVHGGGPQIDGALAKIGKKGEFIQGMRVTDAETMDVVEWVLGGEVQQDIVTLINQAGGKAVGLTGQDGGLIRAKKLRMMDLNDPTKEHDVGSVGEIESIDPSVVKALQDDAFIPVISPLGFGADNETYNINADVVAGKLAEVLKAEKLMMLTNIPGVLDKSGKLLTDLTAREIDELFADGTISGGMLPKISSALDAAKIGRQHRAHHRRPGAARDAAGSADRAGLRDDDPVEVKPAVWLFDLDNTLHDASHASFGELHVAMGDYVARHLGLSAEEAGALRHRYWLRYGATLLGLVRHHGVRAAHFLEETHRLPGLEERLRTSAHDRAALARLAGRKIILTNAPRAYAERVLGRLGLAGLFDGVIAIEDMTMFGQPRPKPDARMLRRLVARLGVPASRCVLVEDTLQHLKSARAVGMRTVWMQRYLGGRFRGLLPQAANSGADRGRTSARRCP